MIVYTADCHLSAIGHHNLDRKHEMAFVTVTVIVLSLCKTLLWSVTELTTIQA